MAGSATPREERGHSVTCEGSPGVANPSREAALPQATVLFLPAAPHGRTRAPPRPAAAAPAVHGLKEGRGGGNVPLPPGGGNHPASPAPPGCLRRARGNPDRRAVPQRGAATPRRLPPAKHERPAGLWACRVGAFAGEEGEGRVFFGRRGSRGLPFLATVVCRLPGRVNPDGVVSGTWFIYWGAGGYPLAEF